MDTDPLADVSRQEVLFFVIAEEFEHALAQHRIFRLYCWYIVVKEEKCAERKIKHLKIQLV